MVWVRVIELLGAGGTSLNPLNSFRTRYTHHMVVLKASLESLDQGAPELGAPLRDIFLFARASYACLLTWAVVPVLTDAGHM